MTAKKKWNISKKIICSLIVAGILFAGILSVAQVSGDSMKPTLMNGSFGLCIKKSSYDIGDLIAFKITIDGEERDVIKRIVAKRFDDVSFHDGYCYVNEEKSPYEYAETEGDSHKVLDDYYVLGDNRPISVDSRYFGDISDEIIYGEYFDLCSSSKAITIATVIIVCLIILVI